MDKKNDEEIGYHRRHEMTRLQGERNRVRQQDVDANTEKPKVPKIHVIDPNQPDGYITVEKRLVQLEQRVDALAKETEWLRRNLIEYREQVAELRERLEQ